MRLVIFGATGRSGRELVREALRRGHQVTAFARSPRKLADFGESIEIIEGDIEKMADVTRAVAGADAVLSVLGPTANRPDTQVLRGTQNIVQAMQRHGVRRLVASVGAGIADENDTPGLLHHAITWLLKRFSRHVYEEMRQVAQVVRGADLAWTLVRAPMLTDAEARGPVRVGYVGKGPGPRLARTAMARFMLDVAEQESYVHDAPVISD